MRTKKIPRAASLYTIISRLFHDGADYGVWGGRGDEWDLIILLNFFCDKLAETNANCVFPYHFPPQDKQHLVMCMKHYPDEQPCGAYWKWSH